MAHDKVTWQERHAWAWQNSKPFPARASVITTLIGGGLLIVALFVLNKLDGVGDVLIRLATWAVAAFILTPVALYTHKFITAPGAILGGRLAEAERRQKMAARERDLLVAEKAAAPRPSPRIWFSIQGKVTRLNVRNLGAPAVFHANSMVLWANAGRGDIEHAQRLRWSRAANSEAKIVTGGEDNCIVAAVEVETRPVAQFTLQAICESPVGLHQPTQVYWSAIWLPEARGIEPARPCALCEITVTAEPEMPGGPIRKRFQLGPGGVHEEGTEGYSFDAEGRFLEARQ